MAAYNNPRTLLIRDEFHKETFIADKWYPTFTGLLGFGGTLMYNYSTKLPLLTGIHRHIGITLAFIVIGKYLFNRHTRYIADRDAVFRHYIELHPDDFPVPERRLLKDVFKPWHPIR